VKIRVALALLLVALLAITAIGSNDVLAKAPLEGDKTTGGGWFYDDTTGDKITFSFTAQPGEQVNQYWLEAKGTFTLIDHASKNKIKGTFEYQYIENLPEWTCYQGSWTAKGAGDDNWFEVWFYDCEKDDDPYPYDWVTILDYSGEGKNYSGDFQGGGLKIHDK